MSTTSSTSNMLRITGMATGLDTDTMVKQLMKAESTKLDKVLQSKQLIQWKQDLYRDITNDLVSFRTSYFNVVNSSSYMLSPNNYASFDATSTDTTNSVVTATGRSGAVAGTYTIKDITIAAKASLKGTSTYDVTTSDKMSKVFTNDTDANVSFSINGKSFSYDFGSSGADKDMTIQQVLTEVSSTAGVNIRFSELTKTFSIESLETGGSQNITASETSGKFLDNLFNKSSIDPAVTKGSDATVTIKDPLGNEATVTRASNSFTIDGVSYNLLKNDSSVDGIKITLTPSTQKVYDKIKTFIDKYNEIIDKINTKITQKKQYDYAPLTDDQKESMSDDDIKKWEDKAKEGIIQNDSILQNMLYSMRSAFYTAVKDSGITLSEVGLSTSSDYSKRGKIIIDEAKLKDAIQNKGKQVIDLFTKTSASKPTYDPNASTSDRTTRMNEEGIFQRVFDVLQDNIRTTRNSSGKKGLLIEKAGLVGDFTEFNNLLTKELTEKNTMITRMSKVLADKETRYYNQFAKLETAMNQMNNQSNWLTQQLSSMS